MSKIAVIKGDGVGPEVTNEALKVLKAADKKIKMGLQFTEFNYDGERYLKTGEILSDEALEGLRKFDAILLGAIGHPKIKPGIMERGVLLKLRFGLDLYINLRPVKLYENVDTPLKNKKPQDIDYVVVRENTGDLYSGIGGVMMKYTPNEVATQSMVYTRYQVERCVRYAFEYAKNRHQDAAWRGLTQEERAQGYKAKLTLCGKSNVLTYVFDLWERVFYEVAKEYKEVKTDYVHVDAICIYMLECPERFDVIVTTNMFGDIITDLAATTQGGMGLAPSGNINPNGVSMFEPIHGTAPAFTGLNQINPLAAISAGAMMLAHLKFPQAAQAIETAMMSVIKEMKGMTVGRMGFSTTQIGDMISEKISLQR